MTSPSDADLVAAVDAPGLAPSRRALVLAHAAACLRHFDEAGRLFALALKRGAGFPALQETALQVAAYAGFPTAIATLELLAGLRPGSGSERPFPADANHADRGRETFEAVYAGSTDEVLAHLENLMSGLSEHVLGAAYGRILSRPGLGLADRELMAVSALACMGLGRPLESHIRGALRNGCGMQDVEDILQSSRLLAEPRFQTVIDQAQSRLQRRITRS